MAKLVNSAALVLSACAVASQAMIPMEVAVQDDASFSVSVNGANWLKSAPIRLHADEVWSEQGSSTNPLKKVSSKSSTAADALGEYMATEVQWVTSQVISWYPQRFAVVLGTQVFMLWQHCYK